LTIGPLFQ